jgi:CRISPR/Cas system CSM-associated protein Csm4 (group 5 of RAMP superfamily)
VPAEANRLVNLSLWCPGQDELSTGMLQESSFALVKRGGYLAGSSLPEYRHFRKRSVYMFMEGGVFPAMNKLQGKIVDLVPPGVSGMHPVWRDGRSLFIPLKTEGA